MAQAGSTCDDPLMVTSMPFTDSGNTSTYGNNYSSSDMPPLAPDAVTNGSSSSYLGGDDVVYSYTAGSNGFLNVNASGVGSWVGMYVFTGCNPFVSAVGTHTSSSSGTRSIPNIPVLAGETYYIIISTWPSPDSTDYTLTLDGPDVAPPPTCPKPIELSATNVSTNSADINWTENGTATSWDIEYGEYGFTQGTGTMILDHSSTTYSLAGLNSSTQYTAYVRAVCDTNDSSFWSGPLNFRTSCEVVSTLPYIEDFDTYGTGPTAFPACWERVAYTSGSNVWPSIVSGNATSTPNSLRFQSVVGTPTYAVSPPFAEDITNLRATFMLKREGTSSGTIDVGVMSDASDINTFELVQTINPADNNYHEYFFDLNQVALSGSGNYIALRHNSNSNIYYYWLDNFEVDLVPSCIQPTALTATDIMATTADVSWALGASETAWNISWGPSGYTPGDGDEIGTDAITAASYQITNLSANTNYQVYVQADCGGGDLSNWTGPLSFRTGCDVISNIPYLENFDTYGTGPTAFPACWERPVTYTSGTNIWPSIVSGNATSTPNSLRFQSLTTTPTYAVSPPFAEDINNLRVSFMLKREGTSSGTIDVGVMSDANDINTFELVQTIDPADNNYYEYVFNLNQTTLSGSGNFIAFRHNSNANNYYYWLDDFEVDIIPSCLEPVAVTASAITTTTADISWAAGDSETAWNISWGTPGYTPGDGDELGNDAVVATSYQLTNLVANTNYQVYVQADCGGGDLSYWTGPLSLRTACGAMTEMFENFDSYTTGSIVPDCWERMVPASSAGSQTISSTTPASGTRNMYQYTSSTSNPVVVVLPEFSNINAGTHWLRLQARVSSGAPGTLTVGYVTDATDYDSFVSIQDVSITNTAYGTNSEYTVVVPTSVPANARLAIHGAKDGKSYYWDDVFWELTPTCLPPTALVATGLTETTADVSWTAGDTETAWNISWGTPGFTPGDVNEIGTDAASTTSYQIIGLTMDTYYDVYVQASCGPGDGSIWVGPLEIFTGYCQVDFPSNVEPITYVNFAGIVNTTGAAING